MFNRQVRESVLFRFQKLQRAAQDRLAGALTAWSPRATLAAEGPAIIVYFVFHCLMLAQLSL